MTFEMRAKCPNCERVRLLWGPHSISTDADLTAAETLIDIKHEAHAICPICGRVELIAMFVNGRQADEWLDADEYERLNGPDAGPLPPTPELGD